MAAPNGLFAQALTVRSRSVLLWSLPLWGVFLLAAAPWRGEGGGWAPAFALWAANARAGGMPVTGGITAGLWALAGLLALRITWRGLIGLLAPARSGPWRALARSGDAAAAIAAIDPQADFEAVIAPVKAAKGLGDQLAARADRAGPGEG